MYHRQKSTVCGRFYNYFQNISKWAYTCGKRTGGYRIRPYGWGCADAVGADSISARGHIKRLPFEGSSRRQAGEGWLL